VIDREFDFDLQQDKDIFLLFKTRLALELVEPILIGISCSLARVKWMDNETDSSTVSSVEIKNVLRCTTMAPYDFMGHCAIRCRNNYTFTFTFTFTKS